MKTQFTKSVFVSKCESLNLSDQKIQAQEKEKAKQ